MALLSALSWNNAAQDGSLSPRPAKEKYREAAQKFFTKPVAKEIPSQLDSYSDRSREYFKADDTVPLDDSATPLPDWDTVSTPADIICLATNTGSGSGWVSFPGFSQQFRL